MIKRTKKSRVMYMHTLNGKPASYEPGHQIAFALSGRYARRAIHLVASVADIKRERQASNAYRLGRGFRIDGWDYGYVRVEIPE